MTDVPSDFRQRGCIAAPCPGAHDATGEAERVGICRQCGLFVYDLTDLNEHQAATLTLETEALPGPRFFRRQDGKFLTRNCPVGLEQLRMRLRRSAG
jgi:hypothetical protein